MPNLDEISLPHGQALVELIQPLCFQKRGPFCFNELELFEWLFQNRFIGLSENGVYLRNGNLID